jgi:hypothetical protein
MANYFVILNIVILFLISYALIGNSSSNAFGQINKLIFTPSDNPYNKTFAKWAADWWEYHLGIKDIKNNPNLSHPRDNYSPEKCSWNQNDGPVWFLPDGKDRADITEPEVRICTVPPGKSLMVQIVGSGCSEIEGYKTEKALLDCAVWVLPQASFSASIDGDEVINTNKNPSDREKCFINPFKTNLTYVEDSFYHYKAGTYPGMVAGCYLFIKPLNAGIGHEIVFKESAIQFSNGIPVDKRLTHVKYLINIK